MRGSCSEFFPVPGKAIGQVDHRCGRYRSLVALKSALAFDETVELPYGQLARPQQFPRVPFYGRCRDKALTVVQASANGNTDAEPTSLEGEEPDNFRSVGEHGYAGIRAEFI